MYKIFKTLLLGSIVVTSQSSFAESYPMVPAWNNNQTPIAWGDCIPVPVVPMTPQQNMPMGNMPPMPMYPVPAPILLPPPTSFVAPAPDVSCGEPNKQALIDLQKKYDLAAQASTNKIKDLSLTLDDAQHQMTDGQQMIVTINEENSKLVERISRMTNELGKLDFKYNALLAESGKLKKANDKLSDELKTTISQDSKKYGILSQSSGKLKDTYNSLQSKLKQTQNELSAKTRMLTVLNQNQAEFTALKGTYKDRNNENETLKKKIAELEKKLKTSSTAQTLKGAQDNETIDALKNKLKQQDDTIKTLTSKLAKVENNAGSQARKLTALGQSTIELQALRSAYKERNDESAKLKEQLAKLDDSNKTLKSKLAASDSNTGNLTRKLTALGKSATALTAMKSAYDERNTENEKLKQQLADLNKAKQADAASCDSDTSELQGQLTSLQGNYKSLAAELATATADSDKDGVLDSSDKCPFTIEGTVVDAKGCLADSDKDGVADTLDKCPSSPFGSHVNEMGCPKIKDADNDGVADASDLCANSAANATVNEFGCSPTENITLKGVTFTTGSARLTATSLPIIDAAATTLKQSPNLNIEIAGYTDNQGIAAINKNLSTRRANTVMIQLIKNGVSPVKLTAKGYGEANPVASNDTASGRATNRRVELKINK